MSFKWLPLFGIVFGAMQIAPVNAARIFLTARNYQSGEYPVAAVVQDFNNDGIADIATANQNDANVSVFLGNGNGSFGPANTFAVGPGAIEIASGDLNGDGKADLLVTGGLKALYVVLGNGDGTFGPPASITLHQGPVGLALADLNADGILDVAIAIFGPPTSQGEAAILIGRGDGTFASPVYYPLTHNGSRLVTADLNNDGKLDLAVAVQHVTFPENGLAVLLGNGDGTFQSAVTSVAGDSLDVAANDFNGDGKVDLALTGSGTVRVVLGNGDGTFGPATTFSTGGDAVTVSAADLSGDGVADLLIGGAHTAVLLGNGDGTFGPAVLYAIGNRFARLGYFNQDRVADVVAGGGFSEIGVAVGNGDGSFRAPLSYLVPPLGFDAGDFNNDGFTDMVAGGQMLLLGTGDGGFVAGPTFSDVAGRWVRTADFNHDGKADIVAVPFNDARVFAILGNGDGTFRRPHLNSLPFGNLWPVVADFNHDGLDDVAVTAVSDNTLLILIGKGDGTFQDPITYATGDTPQSPIASDFNGDGNLDLAVSNTFGGTVGVYLGRGDGTFEPPLSISSPNPVYSAPGDFNQDGKPDFVLGGDSLKVFLGNGDGTFQPPQVVYSEYGAVRVADIDGDGRQDIAVSKNFEALAVLRGKGDGTFHPAREFPTGSQFTGDFVLNDLTGDGLPEATVSNVGDVLSVLLNITSQR
jgi:FG-GAP-like repeat